MRIVSVAGAATFGDLEEALVKVADIGSSELTEALEDLIERGDLHVLETPGEAVYAAAAMRRVSLAGRTLTVGTGHASSASENGSTQDDRALAHLLGPPSWKGMTKTARTVQEFAAENSGAVRDDADVAEAAAWRVLAERGMTACALSSLPTDPPRQLRRLALLTTDWEEAQRSALDAPLRIWAGFDGDAVHDDPAQARVIALFASARTVVVAGPGSGKTHTIRDRLAHLLRTGLPAPGITVIAYSRAAVSELRARLTDLAAEEPFDVTTMDSLAGRLSSAATGAAAGTTYEDTIHRVARLFRDGDRIALSWASERQHVVFDEAQDIVGARRDLMMALIEALPETCGATVFCDPAQAIYGYDERQAGRGDPSPIDALLVEEAGFDRESLRRNHRTTDPALLRIASEGREILDTSPDGATALERMRTLLNETCDAPVPGPNDALPMPSLSLFRSGHAAAGHAGRMARHGLTMRMTGGTGDVRPPVLAPTWVGRAMARLDGKGPEALPDAVAAVADDPAAPEADTLSRIVAPTLGGGRYEAARMAAMIEVGTAPSLPDPPTLQRSSTIHSAKGREAPDVALYLPREPDPEASEADLWEMARLFFVGATRARHRLYVAAEGRAMSRQGTRFWRRKGNAVQVQLTRHDAAGTVAAEGADETTRRDPVLRWDRETRLWGLHASALSGEETMLATLPESFSRDVAMLCKAARPGALFVPVARGTLRIEWATIAQDGMLHVVPTLEGFVWINFRRKG